MFSKRSTAEVATSSADEYNLEGVFLTRGDNDRVGGKRKVDRMLADLADGQPGLVIFDNCANLIRTLPALVYDETNAEDIDTDQEDHAYDAMKYGLTAQAGIQNQPRPKPERSPMQEIGGL
jgi:hypothetical protein